MTIYNNLTDMEALKIGTHHNLVAERSKEMSFVDKVGVVKKVVDTDPPNLYKTPEVIFGAKVIANMEVAMNKFWDIKVQTKQQLLLHKLPSVIHNKIYF